MIRGITTRLRRVLPFTRPTPINQIGLPPATRGSVSSAGSSTRRGMTVTPLSYAVANRRAANRRARASRRRNRVS